MILVKSYEVFLILQANLLRYVYHRPALCFGSAQANPAVQSISGIENLHSSSFERSGNELTCGRQGCKINN